MCNFIAIPFYIPVVLPNIWKYIYGCIRYSDINSFLINWKGESGEVYHAFPPEERVVLLYQTNIDLPGWYQGSHPTWKTFKTCNFVIFFSMPGKYLEFAQKVVQTWNFNSKPGKNLKLQILCFKLHFSRCHLQK